MLNGKTIVFDLEGDGLDPSVVWCISAKEVNGELIHFGPQEIRKGLEYLSTADQLVGHNIIDFDIPVIKKLYDVDLSHIELIDTLTISRLLWPERPVPPGCTSKGGHSLDSWGWRVNRYKPEHEDWSHYTPDMARRCNEDVEINELVLFELLKEMSDHDWGESVKLELDSQRLMTKQRLDGFYFDEPLAKKVVKEIEERLEVIDTDLEAIIPGKYKPLGTGLVDAPFTKAGTLSKRAEKYAGEHAEHVWGPFCPVEYEAINLNSDKQVKDFLLLNGWKPIAWNFNKITFERTSPKLEFADDDSDGIDGDIGKLIKERKLLTHRMNQIKGWLGVVREDSTIAGDANTCGTPTGRMHHRTIVNVPKAASYIRYGTEMRSMFRARPGRVLVGRDASQIELRMLAHYMNDYDYIQAILEGDIHTHNQTLAGLTTRDQAKTFIYAFNYGAGDEKLGSIVGGGAAEGKVLRATMMAACPALNNLITTVKKVARDRGYLIGLSGRKIIMRRDERGRVAENKALNALLQGAAADVMKKADQLLFQWVEEEGLDVIKVIDMHDENQADVRAEHAERYAELAELSVVKAGEHFKLNIPLAAESKIGKNWAETH